MKNTVHFVIQGKGGIGKSWVSVLLAQYLKKKAGNTVNFDTDQENTTFAHYKALSAIHISVMTPSRIIDAKKFDGMIEKIMEADCPAVIDNGANTFSPLLAYMLENSVIDVLQEGGKKVFFHIIIGGGSELKDTKEGFVSFATQFDVPIVLWLNEFFGSFVDATGTHLAETEAYKANEDKVTGVVLLPARNQQTFGDDIRRMNTMRLTFDEVIASNSFGLMEKQRLKTVGREVFEQLDKIEF
ncbi:MAG: conjugal transfer protein TraL [Halothiobacillaceae bacterium]|nr:conjugal transfer protein TraL [Halothiobacillaceae bacterium]